MPNSFIDSRTDAAPGAIAASVCIIGAGAAGLTLARELADKVPGTILIESGGFDLDGATQQLCAAEQLGLPYFDLASSRLRYFGGTTNHWSGYCRANDPIDYEGRANLNLPAWPVSHGQIAPYVDRAGALLGLDGKFFESRSVFEREGFPADHVIGGQHTMLETKVFQIATDIRLGQKWRDDLAQRSDFKVFLHLNATHIQLAADGGRVESVLCKTLEGKEIRVGATHFILACHAIENARLLLTANDIVRSGIGNQHDHVGRYFMDHIHIFASKLVPSSNLPPLYNRSFALARSVNANLGFTDDALRKLDILQYYCRFWPYYTSDEVAEAVTGLRRGFMEPGDLDYLRDIATVLSDLDGAAESMLAKRGIAAVKSGKDSRFASLQPAYFLLDHRIEQAPNPRSRIVISGRRDALGGLIADLEWRLSETDFRSFEVAQATIASELSALGYGRVELEELTPELIESRVEGHYHNIGTTRMSDDPKQGVVDSNGRVHGVGNLFVAGSSIFPTAGYSGPTMMIIAFALRLADHLKQLLQV